MPTEEKLSDMRRVTTSDGHNTVRVYADRALGIDIDLVVEHEKFRKYLDGYDYANMPMTEIILMSTVVVGGDTLLFALFRTNSIHARSRKNIPSVVFLRGDSISVVIRVNNVDTGEKLILLVQQARVPIGEYCYTEMTAGMMDAESDAHFVVLKEIGEETGLNGIRRRDLIRLGRIDPSAGGCNESVECFFASVELDQEQIDAITSRYHGDGGEHEMIRVLLLSPVQLIERLRDGSITDAKVSASIGLMMAFHNPTAVDDMFAEFGEGATTGYV